MFGTIPDALGALSPDNPNFTPHRFANWGLIGALGLKITHIENLPVDSSFESITNTLQTYEDSMSSAQVHTGCVIPHLLE